MLAGIPCTLILGLFLAPYKVNGIAVASQFPIQHLLGKRIKLLNPDYCNIVPLFLASFLQKIIIYLATAQYDTPYLVRINIIHFRYYRLELRSGQILQTTDSQTMP